MQNDPSENEQIFRDLVNSIIGQPDNTMDPCFDASVVEKYLEQNSKNKIFYLGSKIVEVGRTNVITFFGQALASATVTTDFVFTNRTIST